jgi:hypothetical protein
MSRYRGDYRGSGDLPYRDGPPARWDRDTFARAERDRYGPPIIEQRPPYAEPYSPPRRGAPVYEEERYYEQDRYGPGGRTERRYYEEDIYRDPRAAGGAMVPFSRPPARPEPPAPVAPPRMVRRQSSLDFYDRRAPRRESYDDYGPPPARGGPPPMRGGYDDVQVQDPYAYGDDGFREYREREWVRRRRNSSGSRSRSRPRTEFAESVREEEKSYPRRGKTRMPKRLVHTKVLYELGYPYYEEVSAT